MPINKRAANSAPDRRIDDRLESHHRVQADVEQYARHQRADRRGRFAVRVGQPRVHRREPCLCSIADEDEHERQPHHLGLSDAAAARSALQLTAISPAFAAPA